MWHRSYIKKILENPPTIGVLVPQIVEYRDGRKVRIPLDPVHGYFPAVVDEATYQRAQAQRIGVKAPAVRHERGSISNLLASLGRCPVCNGAMT